MLTDLSLNANSVSLLAGELSSADGNCCSKMNPTYTEVTRYYPSAHIIFSEGCTGFDN